MYDINNFIDFSYSDTIIIKDKNGKIKYKLNPLNIYYYVEGKYIIIQVDSFREIKLRFQNNSIAFSDEVNGYTKQQYALALSNYGLSTWDLDTGQSYILTLTGNTTITPTNMKSGATYIMILKQDGTGNRTITWNSVFKWAGGTAPTLSTGANDVDIITFLSDGGNLYGTIHNDFS